MKIKAVFKKPIVLDGIPYKKGDSKIMDDGEISKRKISNLVEIYEISGIKEVK